jgi:TetR/AcrR family transcriptional regulator
MNKQRKAQNLGDARKPDRAKPSGARSKVDRNGRSSVGEVQIARLLEAAEAVFAERGYTGASTSAIAAQAKVPKPNLHYYFRTKEALYRAVLANVLDMWLDEFARFTIDSDPSEVITEYIAAKLRWSKLRPNASKVFANEILHGAPFVGDYLATELRRLVESKARIIRHWIKLGKMNPVDPKHLIFQLWAATQHYADFEVQVRAVLGRDALTDRDYATAAKTISNTLLHGCLTNGRAPLADAGE